MMVMIKFCDLPTRRASSALLLATSISSNVFVIWGDQTSITWIFQKGYSVECECRENHTYHQCNKEDKYWSPLSTLLVDQAHQASPRLFWPISSTYWSEPSFDYNRSHANSIRKVEIMKGTSSSCPNITAAFPSLVQALTSPGWQKIYKIAVQTLSKYHTAMCTPITHWWGHCNIAIAVTWSFVASLASSKASFGCPSTR